ncbi:hypothetical protein DV515_00001349 [Chloebia gouldiae]|uniref:Uncharacterized protein n=1 Tax=Chloebia gouldiae TaxID=44316 RepID=A0A3L8SZB4_CHLGU|nr:hypothetical protein DV515_00001349 [Chloebia gouldiae]
MKTDTARSIAIHILLYYKVMVAIFLRLEGLTVVTTRTPENGGLLRSSGSAEACLSRGYQKSVSVTGVDVIDFKGQI